MPPLPTCSRDRPLLDSKSFRASTKRFTRISLDQKQLPWVLGRKAKQPFRCKPEPKPEPKPTPGFVRDGPLAGDLHAYLAGACRALGSEAYRVGGTEDHVHLACTLPRTLTVSKLLEEIKKTSSARFKRHDPRCAGFVAGRLWRLLSGRIAVGRSIRYNDTQKAASPHASFPRRAPSIFCASIGSSTTSDIFGIDRPRCRAPPGLDENAALRPRATPWAGMSRPFGAESSASRALHRAHDDDQSGGRIGAGPQHADL